MTTAPAILRVRATVQPATVDEPVTVAEAKAHCRVDHDTEDAWFTARIAAARTLCEYYAERTIAKTTLEGVCESFPTDGVVLPRGPLHRTSGNPTSLIVTYRDVSGATQTLDGTVWALDESDGNDPKLVLASSSQVWPPTDGRFDGVKVTYIAGTAPASVPEPVKQAVLMCVAFWYQHRENTGTDVPDSVDTAVRRLMAQYWPGRW